MQQSRRARVFTKKYRSCMQVAPYSALAAQLADAERLAALHWDARSETFADWGNHTEGVRLEWVAWQTPQGAIVRRALVRVEDGPPPAPGFVPHFGCARGGAWDTMQIRLCRRHRAPMVCGELGPPVAPAFVPHSGWARVPDIGLCRHCRALTQNTILCASQARRCQN